MRSASRPTDGEYVDVCPLCQEVALEHGWLREGSPTTPTVADRLAAPPPHLGEPARRPAHRGGAGRGRADPAPPLRARARAVVEAADLFNASPYRRTVAGIAKSLGAPQASIVPLSGVSGEMIVTVAWEISWYQYRVTPESRPAGPARRARARPRRARERLPGLERAARRRRAPDARHRPGLCPRRRRSCLRAAALALIVVPGPAVLYIVAQSIDSGRARRPRLGARRRRRRSGSRHGRGDRALGAARLVSDRLHRREARRRGLPDRARALHAARPQTRGRAGVASGADAAPPVRQGVVVNILNPKTALFFFAFLPQFVDPEPGDPWRSRSACSGSSSSCSPSERLLWALAAGTASARLRGSRSFLAVRRYVSGPLFVGLGAVTALAKRH